MNRLYILLVGVLFFVSTNGFAQNPENIGFEENSFKNWTCYIGDIRTDGTITVTPTGGPVANRHTLIDKSNNGLDRYGRFPMLCPNGSNYSVKLGDDVSGAKAERLSYKYAVPAGHDVVNLTLNYAVVLQNTGHLKYQEPRFTFRLYNETDNKVIDCPAFDYTTSTAPGFKPVDLKALNIVGIDPVSYKDWSTTIIKLVGYAGKTVRLELTTTDCGESQHFGYAYFDLDETGQSAPITGNTYCEGQPFINLHAPNGYSDYKWYLGTDFTQPPVGSGQNLKIASPPNNAKYTLLIEPYAGVGCKDTLYTTITKITSDYKLVVPDTIYACAGKVVDLTDAAVTAGSTPGLTYTYHKDDITLDYLYKPEAITAAGVYYIRGTSPGGCVNVKPVYVKFEYPPIAVTNPLPVQYPESIDLSKTYTPTFGLEYSYYSDAAATIKVANPVTRSGTYYIKSSNHVGCFSIAPVKVIVTPTDIYAVTAPNTFTPNNDGINDDFTVSIPASITFTDLQIYNRYGYAVFRARGRGQNWNGTLNGKQVPAGTYYWVFEGVDGYNNIKIAKSGSITIIR